MHTITAEFVKSAAHREQSPEINLPEIVIIGRSNVWKSTLINYLTNKKELAKASKVPGKTTLINFFLIDNARLLVDFPWYGYAKKWKDTRMQWLDTMQDYLTSKPTIADTLLLINGHLPPQKVDMLMIHALQESQISYTIIVTKTDKVAMKQVSRNIKELKAFFKEHGYNVPEMLYTSSMKKQWAPGLLRHIEKKIIS